MRKMKWLFPAMFFFAIAGSAFTRQSAGKVVQTPISSYYQDMYGYCENIVINDPNCTADNLGYICYEDMVDDGTGWAVMYQSGFSTVCWQPYYSYYSNYP